MQFLVTGRFAAAQVWKQPATIRYWVRRGWIQPVSIRDGAHLFDLGEIFTLETKLRYRRGGRPPLPGRVALQKTPHTPT